MTMALGIGVGLPFGVMIRRALPQAGSILWYLDPRAGIAASPVDAWSARVGAFSPTAAGAARPTWDGSSVIFNGTTQLLTQATSTAIHPEGATRFTIAGWTRAVSLPASVVLFETSSTTNGITVAAFGAGNVSVLLGGATVVVAPLPIATWTFRAWTFDLSRALGAKARVYRADSGTVAEVAPVSDTIANTAVLATSGTAGFGRTGALIHGSLGNWALWSGVELTLAELQAFAALTVPP